MSSGMCTQHVWRKPFEETATAINLPKGCYLLHWIEAESRASQESFRSCICFWTTGTPSAEVFLWTDSPLVISIFSWISFSWRAVSNAWFNNMCIYYTPLPSIQSDIQSGNSVRLSIPPAWSSCYREHFCQLWGRSKSAACGWCQPPNSAALLTLGRKAGAQWLCGQSVMLSPTDPQSRTNPEKI